MTFGEISSVRTETGRNHSLAICVDGSSALEVAAKHQRVTGIGLASAVTQSHVIPDVSYVPFAHGGSMVVSDHHVKIIGTITITITIHSKSLWCWHSCDWKTFCVTRTSQ